MRIRILVTVLGAFFGAASAHAGLINGDFETGDLTGWTTYTTANGTLGGMEGVVVFDVDGDGDHTHSARFRVGEFQYSNPVREGGGIYQGVMLGAGALVISAEIAAFAPSSNLAGGMFELLFDGAVVDSHDFGLIDASSIERASLFASFEVSAGLHEVRLRMTRPWRENHTTPLQYVDDVLLRGAAVSDPPSEPVPEPGTITLVGAGLLALARARRRRRPH